MFSLDPDSAIAAGRCATAIFGSQLLWDLVPKLSRTVQQIQHAAVDARRPHRVLSTDM
jgi:LPS sulfotransferase NodH